MRTYLTQSGGARRWLRALVPLLALAGTARAQTYNTGESYNTGALYHGGSFTNTAGASFLNAGSTATAFYAGPAFTNAGRYAASAGATDQFIGPAGAAGPQELAGTTAPRFFNLTLANGPSAAFTVSNPQGVRVSNTLALNNGITSTLRTSPDGAIRLLPGATIGGGTLSDARFVDGYVGLVGGAANTAGFVLPVGTAGAYQPLTLTTALTNAADSVRTAYFASDPGTTTNPSDGIVHPRSSTGPGVGTVLPVAFWDWARPTAAPTGPLGVRVALPAGLTVPAARLLLVGWNAAQARWENLSGAGNTATGNARGATLTGTAPAGITALALAEQGIAVRLVVALQGPLNINRSGTMGTGLNREGVLDTYALNQPYNVAPFDYTGTESVSAGYFAARPTLVDWVLLELRSASDNTTIVARQAGLLRNDGVVLTPKGDQTITFPGLNSGSYYLAVRHRNHLTVLSNGAQALSSEPITYNYTTGLAKALDNGNGNSMVLEYGKWAMWAGNPTGAGNRPDEGIDNLDTSYTLGEASQGYLGEYRLGDINLDGFNDNLDFSLQLSNGNIGPFSPLF
jgi:hypothetical protein